MFPSDAAIVAEWLREQRARTGKTQAAVAAEIGVEKRTIERWEAGRSVGHLVTALRLLSVYGFEMAATGAPAAVSDELATLRAEMERVRLSVDRHSQDLADSVAALLSRLILADVRPASPHSEPPRDHPESA